MEGCPIVLMELMVGCPSILKRIIVMEGFISLSTKVKKEFIFHPTRIDGGILNIPSYGMAGRMLAKS